MGNTATRSEYFIANVTAGLNNLSIGESNHISVSPNPVSEYLQFNLPGTAPEETLLRIYSANGTFMRETNLSGVNTYGFDVSKMEAGIYFYVINNAEIIQRGRFEVIH